MMLPQVLKIRRILITVMTMYYHIFPVCIISRPKKLKNFFRKQKYIAICTQPGIYINDDILIIEEMWNSFIVFTSAYTEFCQRFSTDLSIILPCKRGMKQHTLIPKSFVKKLKRWIYAKKELLMNTVYVLCGEKTVSKWFKEYPEKYTKEYIRAIQR